MKFATNILAANLLSIVCVIAATVLILQDATPWAWGVILALAFVCAHSAREPSDG